MVALTMLGRRRWVLASVIIAGIGWEVVEPHTVEVWMEFREPWYNRWITDIWADLLGAFLAFWVTGRR